MNMARSWEITTMTQITDIFRTTGQNITSSSLGITSPAAVQRGIKGLYANHACKLTNITTM
jgi:hypothetical protein